MAAEIQTAPLPVAAFGQLGFDEVTGTESGLWYCLKAWGGSATFSATNSEGDSLSSATVSEGVEIYGLFTSVAVTSGTVIAYRAEKTS